MFRKAKRKAKKLAKENEQPIESFKYMFKNLDKINFKNVSTSFKIYFVLFTIFIVALIVITWRS